MQQQQEKQKQKQKHTYATTTTRTTIKKAILTPRIVEFWGLPP